MKASKKRSFNQKMGRGEPKYLRLKNGGVVRQKFADGGIPVNQNAATLSGPGMVGQNNAVNAAATGPLGAIGNTLGLNDKFQAAGANLQAGTNNDQLNQAYTGAQNGINAQVGLANTFNPQAAQAVAQQGQLAGAYTNMMNGVGPNPATAELAQATGTNVANQAALMAGQRGAGANAGLIARQNAQQGAATQQQAVGQAATLQAQQAIAAQQNLAALSAQQAGQAAGSTTALNQAQQNEQNILQGANTAYNNAAVGMQSNINNVNAQTAAANQNMNANILGGIGSMVSGASGPIASMFGAKGGRVPQDLEFASGGQIAANPLTAVIAQPQQMQAPGAGYTPVSMPMSGPQMAAPIQLPQPTENFSKDVQNVKDANKKKADTNKQQSDAANQRVDQQFAQSPGADSLQMPAFGSSSRFAHADGGEIESGYTQPADSSSGPNVPSTSTLPADTVNFAQAWAPSKGGGGGGGMGGIMALAALSDGGNIHPAHDPMYFHKYFGGGDVEGKGVPALVSPKEVYLSPDKVHKVVHEGADPMKIGYQFPGQDKVKGKNSKKNDFIKTTLQEGGVIVPISVTQHRKAPEKSREFVLKHMRKPGSR